MLDLTLMFAQAFIFPFRFQSYVVSENERTEVLLRDEFCFRFKCPPASADFLVKRNSDRIGNWISKVADQLE